MAREAVGAFPRVSAVRRDGALRFFYRLVRQKPLGAAGGLFLIIKGK